jgi:type I restriction enzyme S subunit
MFITRASRQLLGTRRIDPDYYAPVHVADEQRLRGFGSFDLGECGRFFVGPFGSELPSSLYRASGVPLLRVGNVGQLDMSEDNLAFLDNATHSALKASETLPGDLLIVKASVGEKICRFPSRYERGNITQHIIGIRPNGFADMDYVAVALFSPIGRRQLERRSLGSIIQYLGVVDARTVLIPKIAPDAQRYIGDKVRQAERLRERARRLRHTIDALLAVPALVDAEKTADLRSNRVRPLDLNARLDAKYYGSRAMAVLEAATTGGFRLGSIVEDVNNGFEHRAFDVEGTPYITVTEVSGGHLVLATAPRIGAGVSIPDKARIDTRCALVVRTGSIGVAVPVFEEDTHAVISSHLICLRFQSEQEAGVVAAFLNSKAGRVLQRKISYGAVQPQIGQDELLALPMPKVLLDSAESILNLLKIEDAALRAALKLSSSATTLVEHLIDGRVTEADLVAAQKALEAGDRRADSEILKALRQSDAPDAKPLIADVDTLYALLDDPEAKDA